MSNQKENDFDVFIEESFNEVNAEFTPRSKNITVNQTLHFENRFLKDGKGKWITNFNTTNWMWRYWGLKTNIRV